MMCGFKNNRMELEAQLESEVRRNKYSNKKLKKMYNFFVISLCLFMPYFFM